MAARSIRRWLARAPPPRLQPRTPEQPRSFLREIQRASSGSTPARNFASHSPRECIGGITRRAKEGRSAGSGPCFYAAVRAANNITRRGPPPVGLPPRLRLQAAPAAAARLPPDPLRVRSAVRSAHPETRVRRDAPAVGPC